jgi:phosphoglycerate dehydrogenase-like enzyme
MATIREMMHINVIATFNIGQELASRIESVDARVKVRVLTSEESFIFRGGKPLWPGYGEPPWPEGVEPSEAAIKSLTEALAEAEVMLSPPPLPLNLVEQVPKLRWLQLTSAGAEPVPESEIIRRVVVTTSSGIHATSVGEYTIGMMIMLAKRWPRLFRAQVDHRWVESIIPSELYGKTVGIIGMGHIGREVGRLAKAFGMRIIGLRRSASSRSGEPYGNEVLPADGLTYLLQQSDYVVLTVPLTKETQHLLGEEELRSMKETAVLINVARGAIIDEQALVRALTKGWIAGAALDVFEREPLPPESPLWDMENVIVSPHNAGGTEIYALRAVDLFCANLRRYLNGETLGNVVDPERGY